MCAGTSICIDQGSNTEIDLSGEHTVRINRSRHEQRSVPETPCPYLACLASLSRRGEFAKLAPTTLLLGVGITHRSSVCSSLHWGLASVRPHPACKVYRHWQQHRRMTSHSRAESLKTRQQ